MSLYVSIIGIDGSGKSLVTVALANLIAAELSLTTVAISDNFWGRTPVEDLFRPEFRPDGMPLIARLDRLFRKIAKATTHNRKLYPTLKVAQLAVHELTARRFTNSYHPDVIIGDGNLLLTSGGWAANYITPQEAITPSNSPENLRAATEAFYNYITTGTVLPDNMGRPIPALKLMRWLYWLDQRLKLGLTTLPDALILLDIAPEMALTRVMARPQKPDGHENLQDMTQARTMLHGVAEFFRHRRGKENTIIIDVTELSERQILEKTVEFVRKLCSSQHSRLFRQDKKSSPERNRLGTSRTKLSDPLLLIKNALTYQYLMRYLLPNLHRGSAHELTFAFSQLGQRSLNEGYSAGLMTAIYQQDSHNYLDRIFLNHPLHQAIYHRLQVLKRVIEQEIRCRLACLSQGTTIKVLSAPSGYAFDLLGPLQQIASSNGVNLQPIHILASDLDSDGCIEKELNQAVEKIGCSFKFIRGDLASVEIKDKFRQNGPYDMVLFIGLSSWLPKIHLLEHLKLIRRYLLAPGGLLISDCFTPQVSSISGKYVGYQASYYSPAEFNHLLAYSGFDLTNITWESGPNGVDHICIART